MPPAFATRLQPLGYGSLGHGLRRWFRFFDDILELLEILGTKLEVDMPFETHLEGSGVRLVLTGRLGVPQARSLWDRLQTCLAGATPLSLDAAGLADMDTSIVQILLRLQRRPGGVHIVAVSPGFTGSLKRRGLEQELPVALVPIDAVEARSAPGLSNRAANQGGPNV